MAQKYIPLMEMIDRCHKMKNALPCMEFDFSINPYFGYWYAEEGLYILVNCMEQAYFFELARSPAEAIEKVLKRIDDANHAGEFKEAGLNGERN